MCVCARIGIREVVSSQEESTPAYEYMIKNVKLFCNDNNILLTCINNRFKRTGIESRGIDPSIYR